jgi:hypothetical protein
VNDGYTGCRTTFGANWGNLGAIWRIYLQARRGGTARASDPVRQFQYPAGSVRIRLKIEPWIRGFTADTRPTDLPPLKDDIDFLALITPQITRMKSEGRGEMTPQFLKVERVGPCSVTNQVKL